MDIAATKGRCSSRQNDYSSLESKSNGSILYRSSEGQQCHNRRCSAQLQGMLSRACREGDCCLHKRVPCGVQLNAHIIVLVSLVDTKASRTSFAKMVGLL